MGIISKDGAPVTVEYTITPDDVKRLIAQDLNVPVEEINVHFVIEEVDCDPMDRFRGTDMVTKVHVTHTVKP